MKRKSVFSAILLVALGFLVTRPVPAQDAVTPPVATHMAVLRTSIGDIEIELYGLASPKTVKNFIELAKKQYYNGILFHRVVPNFVVQAGDPYSRDSASRRDIWGSGGRSIYGSTFPDELSPDLQKMPGYREGVLAMANRGPNTNSSQFFIILSDDGPARHLEYKYTIFGRVTKGMDIVKKMEKTELDPRYKGQPKKPVAIIEINAVEVKPTNR